VAEEVVVIIMEEGVDAEGFEAAAAVVAVDTEISPVAREATIPTAAIASGRSLK
jgi:hypothetical protein